MKTKSLELNDLKSDLSVSNFEVDLEANKYQGYHYRTGKRNILQRTAKITPKKIGQFVTLWKRNKKGITAPIDIREGYDFVIIICKIDNVSGHFRFPVEVLVEKGIMSSSMSSSTGKRGFRVYPEWDSPLSSQASKAQKWQSKYFII